MISKCTVAVLSEHANDLRQELALLRLAIGGLHEKAGDGPVADEDEVYAVKSQAQHAEDLAAKLHDGIEDLLPKAVA